MDNYISYEFDSNSIWKIAEQKIRSFKDTNSDYKYDKYDNILEIVIENGVIVLGLLKMHNIFPNRIVRTNDGSIFISFCTFEKEYDMDVSIDGIQFCINTKSYLKKRDEKGRVQCEFDHYDCNLNTIGDHLSGIKCDTFEDLERTIESFVELPKNWHINYRDSNCISQEMVDRSIKALDILGNMAIKPYAVFPGVLDMGRVCVRLCVRMGKNYFLEIHDDGKFLLRKYSIFENKEECRYSFSSIDGVRDGMNALLTGNTIWCDE